MTNGSVPVTPFDPKESAANQVHNQGLIAQAWAKFGDRRPIVDIREVSAQVSTNHVYRLTLTDDTSIIAKLSSYGSYFLFLEDHDRLHRLTVLLRGSRWEGFLADSLLIGDRPFTFYDGSSWVVFYEEVARRDGLPRTLTPTQVANFAVEIADFHTECTRLAPLLPRTSTSVKSDAIALYDQLGDRHASEHFGLHQAQLDVARHHTHQFLDALVNLGYDDFPKVPVLLDWNLGNFSVAFTGKSFRLFSRWDYDWFRIDTRMLDFYFLSRVSSATGDRTIFTYGSHTLLEPRFVAFLRAYHQRLALSENEILFLKETYRFFILNYVIRSGDVFFREAYSSRFRHEAVDIHLPRLDQLDLRPLVDAVLDPG
jgi:hypothetical protein